MLRALLFSILTISVHLWVYSLPMDVRLAFAPEDLTAESLLAREVLRSAEVFQIDRYPGADDPLEYLAWGILNRGDKAWSHFDWVWRHAERPGQLYALGWFRSSDPDEYWRRASLLRKAGGVVALGDGCGLHTLSLEAVVGLLDSNILSTPTCAREVLER